MAWPCAQLIIASRRRSACISKSRKIAPTVPVAAPTTQAVTASAGIVVWPPDGTPEELLRDADVALHRAKAAGRNQVLVFHPSMSARAVDRLLKVGHTSGAALALGLLRGARERATATSREAVA